jgi:hypothetical protein
MGVNAVVFYMMEEGMQFEQQPLQLDGARELGRKIAAALTIAGPA